jgi:hypothetical protein
MCGRDYAFRERFFGTFLVATRKVLDRPGVVRKYGIRWGHTDKPRRGLLSETGHKNKVVRLKSDLQNVSTQMDRNNSPFLKITPK